LMAWAWCYQMNFQEVETSYETSLFCILYDTSFDAPDVHRNKLCLYSNAQINNSKKIWNNMSLKTRAIPKRCNEVKSNPSKDRDILRTNAMKSIPTYCYMRIQNNN
jgi:hypothetical protein